MTAHFLDLAYVDGAAIKVSVEHRQPASGVVCVPLIRPGQQHDLVRDLSRRRPALRAIDDVFVAVLHRAGFQAGRVETYVGFRHTKAHALFA